MKEVYKVNTRPCALDKNMVTGEKYRITMLTEGLIRLEYCEDGVFEDRPTQMAFFRDFPETPFRMISNEDGIEIHTSRLHLIYNEQEFTGGGLSIQVKGDISAYHSIWHYGEEISDLKGTARTLDMVDGEDLLDQDTLFGYGHQMKGDGRSKLKMEHGVISGYGFSVIDDSKSQVLLENGWIEPRKKGIKDLYFFGYGHDYKEALKGFYYLCGKNPMLPRYALGNWWSRYYKYTEKSYMELMERFDKNNLPFTVAVIDMDWHLVDIDPKYGSGWTGYTWNKELFPDPPRFLKGLHDRGMKITLNVHPADGVRAHEECYEQMAKAMGVDTKNEDPVLCDVANPEFMEAYFEYIHHPLEEDGVDFWWIDWQQGSVSKMEGLDPLWILNHYHFLDSRRSGKRPMTFSRYAGPGSHRYPIGFSGDTITTWESLDFQPYFTATASNIGYGWWSHDIGGHMMGYKDDELVARWVQLGIYSPIMRLHSSCSEFNGKEPWRFKAETEKVMSEALRQRHAMIPYLYSMNYRNYQDDMPLVLPMYYEHPENAEAYDMKNQFYFGTELLVAPITSPRTAGINSAKVKVWLPDGVWYDIYTGMIYQGGRVLDMYRGLDSIPVLAKAGAILPFTDEISGVQAVHNPESLRIKVFAGADGKFELYEDDNETCNYENGKYAITEMTYIEAEGVFSISPVKGERSLIPEQRSYVIELAGYQYESVDNIRVTVDGEQLDVNTSYDSGKQAVIVTIPETDIEKTIKIYAAKELRTKGNRIVERSFDFLNKAEIEFALKDKLYSLVKSGKSISVMMAEINAMEIEKNLEGAMIEILSAY